MGTRRHINPVDAEVGARVKALRVKAGLSQQALGSATGISFQQIQKYETGVNRIAPGRLANFARVLMVPVALFFGEDNLGGRVEVETRINTQTRRDLIATLDQIENSHLETLLLGVAIEHAVALKVANRK
jgi:transcriptional regulator with XRE-family HTH domain